MADVYEPVVFARVSVFKSPKPVNSSIILEDIGLVHVFKVCKDKVFTWHASNCRLRVNQLLHGVRVYDVEFAFLTGTSNVDG